jgi:hypothetical protein
VRIRVHSHLRWFDFAHHKFTIVDSPFIALSALSPLWQVQIRGDSCSFVARHFSQIRGTPYSFSVDGNGAIHRTLHAVFINVNPCQNSSLIPHPSFSSWLSLSFVVNFQPTRASCPKPDASTPFHSAQHDKRRWGKPSPLTIYD